MGDTNRYPNYIGVETKLINSAIIELKYTGEASKKVVVSVGSLVSIGHSVNKNGVLSYELTLGIVKEIGSDPVTRTFMPNMVNVSNPYYLVIDRSNTYASDVTTIYIRDIRDLAVGPMADGDYAKGEMSGDTLPEVNDANKDLYLGRFFYLNVKTDSVGLYYCDEIGWKRITSSDVIDSSPLVTTFYNATTFEKIYALKEKIIVPGSGISNKVLTIPVFSVSHSEDSRIHVCVTGKLISYQVYLDGSSLPSDDSGSDIIESEIASLTDNFTPFLPTQTTPVNINRVNVNGEWKDVYHRITPEGKLRVAYPNVPGITSLNLFGSYLI